MATIRDFMLEQSPQIGVDINQKVLEQPTPWITLYPQETWEDQKSNTQKTFQFDRAQITTGAGTLTEADECEWEDVATDIGTNPSLSSYHQQTGTGDGIPPADYIEFTETIREYNLQHKAIWGPPLNTNKLRDKFVRVQQLQAQVRALADQAREFWINRKKSEFERVCDNLVVCDSAFALSGGKYNSFAYPTYSGTDGSILTNGFTDYLYEFMNHQGAQKGALGSANGRAVYALVTSARQSRRLVMADQDVREDFRYSSQNEKLLAPMGVRWSYNGFSHIIDELPTRLEFYRVLASGGEESAPHIHTITARTDTTIADMVLGTEPGNNGAILGHKRFYPGTLITPTSGDNSGVTLRIVKRTSANNYVVRRADGAAITDTNDKNSGTIYYNAWSVIPPFTVVSGKRVPNPYWLAATWEKSYVFHQGVCTSLVPAPITSVGGATFKALDYSGTFRWTNYPDPTDNPDEQIGRFRGILSNGTRPDNPEFGIGIIHLAVPTPDGRYIDGSALG